MASTFSPLGVELQATGENAGTWGTKTNTNLQIVEQITGGFTTQAVSDSGDTTLSVSDGSTGATLAHRIIEFTGSLTGSRNVTIPIDVQQAYILFKKGVETDPEKAYLQAMNMMQNMSFESEELDEAKGDIRKFLLMLGIVGGMGTMISKGLDATSFKHSELGLELKAAAQQGDKVAEYHYDLLDFYAEVSDQRTLVNLRIAYLEDSDRQDVKDYLIKKARVDANSQLVQKPTRQEAKEPKTQNLVAKHSRNMSGAGAHKDKKKAMKKKSMKRGY